MAQIKNPTTKIQVTKEFPSSEELRNFFTKYNHVFISYEMKDKQYEGIAEDDCKIEFSVSSDDMLYLIESEDIKTTNARRAA